MDINPPQLLSLPGGQSELRDARSGRTNSVALVAFEIGRTAVTWAEFAALATRPRSAYGHSSHAPAHGVTWFDAIDWCNVASEAERLSPAYLRTGRSVEWDVASSGYRLPIEAEWEYACRATSRGPHYGPLDEGAWTAIDGQHAPSDIALKALM